VNGHRLLIAFGGLSGAGGVALSAASAHGGDANLATAGTFLLIHAAALLAVGLAPRGRVMAVGGFVLFAGLAMFAGDLAARHYFGSRLFPMAAPAGGVLLIAGWLIVAASALVRTGEPR